MDGPTATRIDFAIARNGKLDSSVPVPQESAATHKHRSRGLRKVFRLETTPILYFLRVTEILNEPMFRLEKMPSE